MNPLRIIKFIGCWACIIFAVVLLVLAHGAAAPAVGILALLALAFAHAPDAW